MDFLDPELHRKHIKRLFLGYVLIATAVLLAATFLFMIALGFNLSRDGEVIQKGLVFISSNPTGADVYIDGISKQKQTNARLDLAEGSYEFQLKRDGYRTWQRHVVVRGGTLVRYDYPVLFPEILTTGVVKNYENTKPGMGSVSLDHRWLLVEQTADGAAFDLFDLTKPEEAPVAQTLPVGLYSTGGAQRWQPVEWAKNNRHLLLKHSYGSSGAYEYILYDREAPSESVNLSQLYDVRPTEVRLLDGKYDAYYLYTASTQTLQTATLGNSTVQAVLTGVVAFEGYKSDYILYVTTTKGDDGTTSAVVRLRKGDQTYSIRQLPAQTSYNLAIDEFSGDLYVAVAAKAQPTVYVYKNPDSQSAAEQAGVVPFVALPLQSPGHVSFSPGGQLVFAQSGQDFVSYDLRYKTRSSYSKLPPMDQGQSHATWMDGAHLQYVSNGQLYIFDYDGSNAQLLMPAWRTSAVFYNKNQRVVYTLIPKKSGAVTKTQLTSTPLRTPADQ